MHTAVERILSGGTQFKNKFILYFKTMESQRNSIIDVD